MAEDMVTVVVVSDEEADLAALGELEGLTRGDEHEVEELALDPLTAAVLVGVGLAVGKFVLRVINEYRGGVRLDLTSKPAVIKRDREVPYGWIVTLAADGKVEIETKDEPKDSIERMVEAVLKLPVDATVAKVKAAIEAIKPDVKTNVAPAPASS